MKQTVKLVGIGGAGLNIISRWLPTKPAKASQKGFANISSFFIDTSDSNLDVLHGKAEASDIYITEGTKGCGGNRRKVVELVAPQIQQIFQRVTSAQSDFYVLVSSASGGSGSGILPLLAGEFARKRIPFICIFVAGYEAEQRAINVTGTIKSMLGVSEMVSAPLNFAWFENDVKEGRGKTDKDVCTFIEKFVMLTSGENSELDNEDLVNFLYYQPDMHNGMKPQVNFIDAVDGDANLVKVKNPFAIASLLSDRNDTALPVTPRYATHGFSPVTEMTAKLHFVTSTAAVATVLDANQKHSDRLKAEGASSDHDRAKLASGAATAATGGLVFD